ncbi:MAG: flagellar motor switch protein FliG [bacterium]|nr:flagellar motor switch protein FliG [bacterium]
MPTKMLGPDKAAILILSMGEDFASQILPHLENHEVQRLGAYMGKSRELSLEDVEEVIAEYHEKACSHDKGIPHCSPAYVRKIIHKALGEERARPILEKLSTSRAEVDLSFVREMEPRSLVNYIKLEHPQTIALVLSYMSAAQSAEVLSLLPERLRAEVVMRMAGLESVDVSMVTEIATVLEREVKLSSGGTGSKKVSGIKMVAEIMNNLDNTTANEIFSYLEEKEKPLSDGIHELMFVFEDLATLDDRGMQTILKNIDNDRLILALKTASEAVKEKIFNNMSTRAGQMLEEEMDVMGPVRVSEVETAQKEIAAIARKLEESGEIIISKGEGDIVV